MLKFNKPVDQEQGLEEGQISGDDNLQLPTTGPLPSPRTKLIPDQQQQDSPEYVVEQVKIKASSPPPDRKKERKQLRPDDKTFRQEKNFRGSHSPQAYYQQPPVQQSSYFPYPNSHLSYPPTHIDPHQRHPNSNIPLQPNGNLGYQLHPYQQRQPQTQQVQPMQGQWGGQMGISPNKTSMQSMQPGYGYQMGNNYQNAYLNQNSGNYYKPNIYQPNYPSGSYPNGYSVQSQPQYQAPYPQQYSQNHSLHYGHQPYPSKIMPYQQQQQQKIMQQRRKQQEQEDALKQRNKKVKSLEAKITSIIFEKQRQKGKEKDKNKVKKEEKSEDKNIGKVQQQIDMENMQMQISQILNIVKTIIKEQSNLKIEQQQDLIQKMSKKIKQNGLKQKIYEILTVIQLPKLVERLKQKQLEKCLVANERRNEARQVFKIIGIKNNDKTKQGGGQQEQPQSQSGWRRDPRLARSTAVN